MGTSFACDYSGQSIQARLKAVHFYLPFTEKKNTSLL